MKTNCPLCRRSIPGSHQQWCECGQVMDPRCFDAHGPWCSVHGDEAWIGALER